LADVGIQKGRLAIQGEGGRSRLVVGGENDSGWGGGEIPSKPRQRTERCRGSYKPQKKAA